MDSTVVGVFHSTTVSSTWAGNLPPSIGFHIAGNLAKNSCDVGVVSIPAKDGTVPLVGGPPNMDENIGNGAGAEVEVPTWVTSATGGGAALSCGVKICVNGVATAGGALGLKSDAGRKASCA